MIDIDLICKTSGRVGHARMTATRAHAGQSYGKHSFVYHLERVAICLAEHHRCIPDFALERALELAFLHDVIEDVPRGRSFLMEYCIPLGIITDCEALSRGEKDLAAYFGGISDRGVAVVATKLADRIANLCESLQGQPKPRLVAKYLSEREAFGTMKRDDTLGLLWQKLEELYDMAAVSTPEKLKT